MTIDAIQEPTAAFQEQPAIPVASVVKTSPRGSESVLKPNINACKLSKFTMRQMAKRKKKLTGARGSKHYETRRKKMRIRWHARKDKQSMNHRYNTSLLGMYNKAKRYTRSKGIEEMMSFEQWVEMWRRCPDVCGGQPASSVRGNISVVPRVSVERVDKTKGYVTDNIEIWLIEKNKTTLLLSC